MNSSLRIQPRENVLLLHLESPDDFPRLTRAVLANLLHAIESAQSEANVCAAVITGTKKCFAAGADLEEVSALTPLEARRFAELGQSLMRRIEHSRKPVVAAIRGHCLGGGFDLALACHLRVAAADARLGHPGGSLGIFTGWGGTQRLPRLIGRSHAEELLFTGRLISARDALTWKLVNRVVPPEATLSAALHLAQQAASARAAADAG